MATLRVKYVLDLQDLRVSEVQGRKAPNGAFHIESSLKSVVVAAKSEESKQAWIHNINENSRRLRLARDEVRDAYVCDPPSLSQSQ